MGARVPRSHIILQSEKVKHVPRILISRFHYMNRFSLQILLVTTLRSRCFDTEINGLVLVCINMLCPRARHVIHVASVETAD